MKKTLTLLALLTIQISLLAYQPLISNNQLWSVTVYGWWPNPMFQKLGDQVAVGDYTYTQVLTASQSAPNDWMVAHLIREDVANQKVYILDDTEEKLLYDFDVAVNDVVEIFSVGSMTTITITSIETIDINGISREKIMYDNNGIDGFVIEGIGSSQGIFDYALGNVADYYPELKCYYENYTLVFDNSDDESCLATPVEEFNGSFNFSIYPNPATDQLFINVSEAIIGQRMTFNVLDITGRVISTEQRNLLHINTLDVANLSSGNYFLQLITGNNTAAAKPFSVL